MIGIGLCVENVHVGLSEVIFDCCWIRLILAGWCISRGHDGACEYPEKMKEEKNVVVDIGEELPPYDLDNIPEISGKRNLYWLLSNAN